MFFYTIYSGLRVRTGFELGGLRDFRFRGPGGLRRLRDTEMKVYGDYGGLRDFGATGSGR
jgi:hypothetical protein